MLMYIQNLKQTMVSQESQVTIPGYKEENTTDCKIGKHHEEPNTRRERVQEGKITRFPTLKYSKERT